jgi:putative ABC transport system substrate-binding protein
MKRRKFLLFASGLAAWPLTGRAQQAKRRIIGFLGAGTAFLATERVAAFEQRLRELGWVEGQTVAVEYNWAEGNAERALKIIKDFVEAKVDVIVTHATENIIAAKTITPDIPIVFAVAADPIGTGLVASLSRPGGNVTGLSIQATDLAGKRLGLLREVLPTLRQFGILVNAGNPASTLELHEVEEAARQLSLTAITSKIRRAEDLASAFANFQGRATALYVCADPLFNTNRTRISTLALSHHMPMIMDNREFVVAGGLMSYGPNIPDLFRRTADYVDKILKGAKPADLPVEQPTKFDFILNMTAAKSLGVTLPPTLLARADEVIE